MAKTPTDIRSLARKHTATALRTLVAIASCEKANESARVSAATALLNRGWGMPKQTVEHEGDGLAGVFTAVMGISKVAPEETNDDHDRTTH